MLEWNVLNAIKESEGTNKSNKEPLSQEEKQLGKGLSQPMVEKGTFWKGSHATVD